MVSSLIKSLPLIVVIMTAAVDGLQDWGVNYSPSSVCALKGSTVKISCTVKYPPGHVIRTAYWTKHVVVDGESPDLCSDPEKRGRIQCRSEDKDTRSITLTNVTEADKHVYYCRFTTNTDGGRWTGIPGVQLDVTDLQVETEQNVKVGDSVILTCKSSCSLTEQTFIWLRDTQRFTKGIVKENQLHLQSANKSDSGNYRCAVRGNDLVVSPAVYVKVGPDYNLQDWGVYYSPSSVCALKGSTVKISCIAINTRYYDIKTVTWTKTAVYFREPPDLCSDPEKRGGIQCWNNYKDTSSITLTNVTEADEHFYFCKFNHWTVIPAPRLDVTDLQVETQQRVKEGDSVILTCKSSCSLTEQTFIWFRNTKGIVKENQLHLWSVSRSDEGNYQCAVRGNDHVISPPVYLKVESVDGLLDFGVNYSPSYVCTLKGSAVKISCTVEDTHFYDIKTNTWTKTAVTVREPPDLCSDPEKRGGIQCLSEEQTSSITLTNITEADKHVYYCRFTDNQNKRWTVITGAWLDVTDLQVVTQQKVIEGDSVTLTCKSNCSLTEQTFIWFRNTQRFTDRKENQIHLESVSHSDAGNYQCAVRGNEHLISPAVYLNVEYPPKSVSVSVSPSEIVSGDSVTLNCSSDSNPPALNFRWLKGRGMVGYERIFIISNISSDHSEEYKCRSINEHGAKDSDAVKLNLMYKPKSVSVSVSPSGEIVSGDSVTLICSSDSNPPAEISWFKGGTFLGSGDTYSISNIMSESSGNYCCSAENKHGSQSSPAVTVNVMYPPKSVSVFVSPSEIVSGDSVTLNCSSDSNPPALNFSWFKEDETSAVGSGQSFSISSFNSSFSGRFYCEAQNKYGRQRSPSVSLSVEGVQRDTLYLVSGIVAGCGGLIFIIIIFIIVFLTRKKRREGVFEDVNQKQTADAGCDTYRSLDPASRTSADVYSTITSRAPDDTYTALELQSRSSEYETLAVTSADPH